MCRMAIVPSELKDNENISKLMLHLEDAMGGDGNGFAYYGDTDNKVRILKGSGLEIVDAVPKFKSLGDMFLFHSRKTSAGTMCDANTQPFHIMDKTAALCHNGTWSKYDDFKPALFVNGRITADEYKDMSDTSTLAKLFDLPDVGRKALGLPESGVFIIFQKDYSEIYVKSGDWQAVKTSGGAYIYASEFPKELFSHVYNFKSGTIIRAYKDKFKILKGAVTYEKNFSTSYTVHGANWKKPCI